MGRAVRIRFAVLAALLGATTSASAYTVSLSATTQEADRLALSVADPQNTTFGALTSQITVAWYDLTLPTAGTYSVTPVADQFVAANRFGYAANCAAGTSQCQYGWEHTYYVKPSDGVAATKYGLGEGVGPVGSAYFSTANGALAAGVAGSFSISAPATVRFYWLDDTWSDNQGGISLNVALVPEPHEWAMMLAGLGLVGWVARRRGRAEPDGFQAA
jgi:hypothetical protein